MLLSLGYIYNWCKYHFSYKFINILYETKNKNMRHKTNKKVGNGLFIKYNAMSSTSSYFFFIVNCYMMLFHMTCGKQYCYTSYLYFYFFSGKRILITICKRYIAAAKIIRNTIVLPWYIKHMIMYFQSICLEHDKTLISILHCVVYSIFNGNITLLNSYL